jgi:hypothetical protein
MTSTPTGCAMGVGADDRAGTSLPTLQRATDQLTDLGGTARCKRCNRPLRSQLAVSVGYGSHCAMRELAGWSR